MARVFFHRSEAGDSGTRVWPTAFKACLLVCLTLTLLVATVLYLADGRRLPVGSMGITVLRDVQGNPYLVLDRRKATSVMVDLKLAQGSVEVYTGEVNF